MSLQVKILGQSARLPRSNNNGSYNIFSSEEKIIKPNETAIIKTGIMISLPIGYYGMIESTELVISHNIETSNFGSLHYRGNSAAKPIELMLILRNFGLSKHLIKIGDVIGRLVAVQTKIYPILQVENIEEEIDKKSLQKIIEKPKIKSIPVSAILWFKHLYRNDPDRVFAEYCDETIIKQFKEFEMSDEHEEALNKEIVEAHFLWEILSEKTHLKINQDFIKHKAETLREKKSEKKPKKESSKESSKETPKETKKEYKYGKRSPKKINVEDSEEEIEEEEFE